MIAKLTDPLDFRKRIEPSEQTIAMPLDPTWLEWQREAAAPLRRHRLQDRLSWLEDKMQEALRHLNKDISLLTPRYEEYLLTLAKSIKRVQRQIIMKTMPRKYWHSAWTRNSRMLMP